MSKNFNKISKLFVLLVLLVSLTACTSKKEEGTELQGGDSFPKFEAQDFQGNPVTSDVFKDHPVTLLNIWFTGCKGCIDEMPALQQISEELKDKNVKVMSICLDTYEDKKIKEEAEKILQAKGVNYTNLAVKPSEEIDAYLKNLTAFPTNLLINREGKVVGDVSVGSVDDKDKKAELYKKIDEIIANDGK